MPLANGFGLSLAGGTLFQVPQDLGGMTEEGQVIKLLSVLPNAHQDTVLQEEESAKIEVISHVSPSD